MTIVLLERLHEDAEALLQAYEQTVVAAEDGTGDYEPARVRAILTRGRGRVTAELMQRCPQLEVVARCGVGLDNIDLPAARARSIAVVFAPGSTTTAVAEHTMLLMLAAARRLRPLTAAVHRGEWSVRDGYLGLELAGRTLGVLGMGQIGRRVADLGQAFGMRVISWSRSQRGPYPSLALDEVLRAADVLSLHVALAPETRGLIGARELALMQPGALLINTARGALIDQPALRAALAAGRLAGFAADVLAEEPPAVDDALLHDDRTLVTPHTAVLTDRTYRQICVGTASNVLALLRGEAPEPGSLFTGRF
jgi:phosphoglycerate dehydrogenase-like enzyme